MIPWYSASAVNAPSTPPAAPSKCPVMLLVELTMSPFFAQSPNTAFIALVSAMSPTGVEVPWALMYCTCSGRRPASSRTRRMARSAPVPDGWVMWNASAVAEYPVSSQ